MGNRFDYRFPIINLQKGKRNNGRYRDWFICPVAYRICMYFSFLRITILCIIFFSSRQNCGLIPEERSQVPRKLFAVLV